MKDDAIAQLSDQVMALTAILIWLFHFAQIHQLNGIDMVHNKYRKST